MKIEMMIFKRLRPRGRKIFIDVKHSIFEARKETIY